MRSNKIHEQLYKLAHRTLISIIYETILSNFDTESAKPDSKFDNYRYWKFGNTIKNTLYTYVFLSFRNFLNVFLKAICLLKWTLPSTMIQKLVRPIYILI